MANATDPAAAASSNLPTPLPAKKAPPPLETWIITGDLDFRAASKQALAVEELSTFDPEFQNCNCVSIFMFFVEKINKLIETERCKNNTRNRQRPTKKAKQFC